MENYPESMMRVKLPNSASYHSSPSGDTEYEEAYKKAIADVLPDGYEGIWPRPNEKWQSDSEGFTWVRLRCVNLDMALVYWQERARFAEKHIARIKEVVEK